MYHKIRFTICVGILLAVGSYHSGTSFTQMPEAAPNHKPAQTPIKPAQAPPVRQTRNLNQSRHQAAMDELSAAIEARMKVDPHYRAFIKAVDQHNKNADAYAKGSKMGGAK
jgi:hypothetical protein